LGGKEPELVGEAIKYRLDIVGVSSTRKKGSGVLRLTAGWQLFHTGVDPTKFAEAGVAFLVNPALADRVLEWRPISPRIAVLRIKLEDRVLALVQVYAPNTVPEYKPFLEEALVTLNGVARNESIVLMGDFNAHVGKDAEIWRGVIGGQGDVSFNEQGRLLLDFCASSGLSVMNTYFQHRPDHRYTWSRPGAAATQRSIIDFFVVAENLRRSVMDVRVKRGAELSTDHYLVICKLRLARWCLPQRKVQRQSATRICWEALAEDETRRKFADDIAARYSQTRPGLGDVEAEWLVFKLAILEAAEKSCGVKRVGSTSTRPRTAWWTDQVRTAVWEKKSSFRKWLARGDDDSRQLYVSKRDLAKKAVAEAKTKSWEEFGSHLEANHTSARKSFWQTIRRLRKGCSPPVTAIRDAHGHLLTESQDILRRWKEYFSDLLNPVTLHQNSSRLVQRGGSLDMSVAEVERAVKSLKAGKAAGIDELRPEMLKALGMAGIEWMTRLFNVAGREGRVPLDWQTGVVIPLFKKGDQRECSNYRGITLLSLPGKVYAKVLERRCREILEPQVQEEQCGFRPGRSTTDQTFTLKQIFEKSWEYDNPVYMAFVDLEKAYDRVPRDLLWDTLLEYGIGGVLLAAIQSLYERCCSCVRVGGVKSEMFGVRVGLRQGCVLSPLLFITFMDRIMRRSTSPEGIRIGSQLVSSLLFADDLGRLAASLDGLQRALDRFNDACLEADMRISTQKTEVMVLSRKPEQGDIQLNGVALQRVEKFKYLGVQFSSDGQWDGEIDRRIAAAGAVFHSLYRSIVTKRELSHQTKIAVFKTIFRPILTYGCENWVITENVRSRLQAAEMRFLRRAAGHTRWDRIPNSEIRTLFQIEPLLLFIERQQLRWLGHVLRMPYDRLVRSVFEAVPTGKRPRGRPRTRWREYMAGLCWERLGVPWAEVPRVASDREHWEVLMRLLQPRPERI